MNEARLTPSTTDLLSDESRLQDNFTHVVNLVETLIAQYERLQSHLALHNEAAPSHATDLAEEILALQNENKKLHARIDVLMQQRGEDTKTLTEIRRLLDRFNNHKESSDLTDPATPSIRSDNPSTSSLPSRHDKDEHDVTTSLSLANPIKSSESLTKSPDEPNNLEAPKEPPPIITPPTPPPPTPISKTQYHNTNSSDTHHSSTPQSNSKQLEAVEKPMTADFVSDEQHNSDDLHNESNPALTVASEKSEAKEATSKDVPPPTSMQPASKNQPTSPFFSKERIDKVTQSAQTDVGSWLDFDEDQKVSTEDNDQYALDNDEFFKSIDKDEAGK
ncbi:hypothetical protein COTS27_01390 [Spirochaetota bacterium]|nr:hypothetical protein COTS27_01390 [Spirochaetota bacterium]